MIPLPQTIQSQIAHYTWHVDHLGCSEQTVYRLTRQQHCVFLKVADANSRAALEAEVARMRWLQPYLPVPQILAFEQDEGGAYLLMSAIAGKVASDSAFAKRVPQMVAGLAEALRQFHAVPIAGCPFDHRRARQIAAAQQQVQMGQVDEHDFEAQWLGRSADSLFAELVATQPQEENLVLTHGDFCLPNVLLDATSMQVTGFIDLGRVGISDRYTDLALTARSLAMNWGTEAVPALFRAYGIVPDAQKLRFYTLLDEFF